jgi:hypothetical protein
MSASSVCNGSDRESAVFALAAYMGDQARNDNLVDVAGREVEPGAAYG